MLPRASSACWPWRVMHREQVASSLQLRRQITDGNRCRVFRMSPCVCRHQPRRWLDVVVQKDQQPAGCSRRPAIPGRSWPLTRLLDDPYIHWPAAVCERRGSVATAVRDDDDLD